MVLPGFANAHSHAFHRALRGRTHDGGGTFWTWREAMYAVAARLDPDSYRALATAAYAEMALAGVTAVAEFHYLHHGPGGVPYADPHAMRAALRAAAADAGIRLTVLDTCYLAGGFDTPLEGPQLRFGDRDVARLGRARRGRRRRGRALGARGAPRRARRRRQGRRRPPPARAPVRAARRERRVPAPPRADPDRRCSPPRACSARATTAVHATHLTDADIALLGGTGTGVCLCPTTERDLADGIGPARALHDAGVPLSLGSDQHAVVDLIEEARALEMHERLATGERGRFRPAELLAALTNHAADGPPGRGQARGRRARRPGRGAARHRRAPRAPTPPRSSTPPPRPTSTRCSSTAGRWSRAAAHRLGDVGALLAAAIEALR